MALVVWPSVARGQQGIPTVTTVAGSGNPGQKVQFGVVVAPKPPATWGNVSGFVTLSVDGVSLGTKALVSKGWADWEAGPYSIGDHSMTASFAPLAGQPLLPSTGSGTFTIPKYVAGMGIATNADPAVLGQVVKITAIGPNYYGFPIATGQVEFFDGGTSLGTLLLDSGARASVTETMTFTGIHNLRIQYNGDPNYLPEQRTFNLQVNQVTGALTVAAAASAAEFGTAANFAVSLTNPLTTLKPTGQIQLMEGGTVLGTSAASSAPVSITAAALAVGSHQIWAKYSGDVNWAAVQSSVVPFNVSRARTTTVLTATYGSPVTLFATVSGAAPAQMSGLVQFVDSATQSAVGIASVAPGSPSATLSIPANRVPGLVGHPIVAVYAGDPNFAGSTSAAIGIPMATNAAGGYSQSVAPDEFITLLGYALADSTAVAKALPLPETLGAASVAIADSNGTTRAAGLSYASPDQINLVIPSATAPGAATLILKRGSTSLFSLPLTVSRVAPGIFTATADGRGQAAAQIVRIRADGSQVLENALVPITLSAEPAYLLLYATGLRNRTSNANVICTIGGTVITPEYAGAHPDFPGLDQVNVLLPAKLAGAGVVDVLLTVDGIASNTATLTFQ